MERKYSDQFSLCSFREKLNAWLIAKGKTPTRYRHLCCFDEQVSAKKKKVACTKSGLSADELAKQVCFFLM